MDDDGFGMDDAMLLGTGFALHAGQTDRVVTAIDRLGERLDANAADAIPYPQPEPEPVQVNALQYTQEEVLESWDRYIGQEPLKRQLMVHVQAAHKLDKRLPHTLLASGYPGVGKTTMARLLSVAMGVPILEVVPPFRGIEPIVKAAKSLPDKGFLFIDEIHKLADGVGARGAEVLLKILEDHVAYLPDGSVVQLPDITIVGATTDPDKLPETILDRFKIKPYFQPYTNYELTQIAVQFAFKHYAEEHVDNKLAVAIALACRSTPRIIEEFILAAQALSLSNGQPPSPDELLDFVEVTTDGLSRKHVEYLTSLFQFYPRETKDGDIEYITGESTMMQRLRETKQGIGRIENFLIERGLIDRTPRGRRLTALGIHRAQGFINEGKGSNAAA